MKNNIIFTISLGLLMIFFTSCNDSFLEENPGTFFAPENLYRNTAGFDVALNQLYDLVRSEQGFFRSSPGMFTGTDVSWSVFSHPDIAGFQTYGANITPVLVVFSDWWNSRYRGISWVNLIIQEAENTEVIWTSDTDKARILGEARFFRAYLHTQMATMFGDVPIVDEFYTIPKLDFKRSPKKDVLEFVKQDLLYAVENLEANPGSVPKGKITRWTAKNLLAEIYLSLGEYDSAESSCLDIIQNSPHKLMTSRFGPNATNQNGNVFNDLFLEGNVDYKDGNLESLWVIQQQYNVEGGSGNNWMRRQHVPFYERVPGLQTADSLGGRGVGRVAPTAAYLNLYESDDIRNANNNIRRKWYYNNPKTLPAGKQLGDLVVLDPNGPLYAQHRDIDLYACITKWDFGVQGRGGSPTFIESVKDYAKMRLAETYLFLAEAQLLKGNAADAAQTLNILRARSNASLISASQVDMDFILDERARELYSEEYRRYTLFRTGMFLERVRKMNPQVANAVTERDQLWPIPQSVIDGNTEEIFQQNPGY